MIFNLLQVGVILLMLFVVACGEDGATTDSDNTLDEEVEQEQEEEYVSDLRIENFIVSLSTGERFLADVDNESRVINVSNVASSSLIDDFDFDSNITAFFANPASTILEEWTFGYRSTISFWDTVTFVEYEINLLDYNRGEDNIVKIDLADPDNVKQEILFVGGDMERCQSYLQSITNKEEVVRWLFEDIDFNMCRVSYDKQQEMTLDVKNHESFYANCVKSMQLIREVNPEVEFWATMKSDYAGYSGQSNLPDWICDYDPTTYFYCDLYAGFLADYLEHFHEKGLTIKYLSTNKEWGVITSERAKETIDYLIPILEERGIPIPLLCDVGAWSTSAGEAWVNNAVLNGFEDYYWGFCTHNYGSGSGDTQTFNYEKMVSAAAAITKTKRADLMTPWAEPIDTPYYCIASESGGSVMDGGDPATYGNEIGIDYRDNQLDAWRDKCEFYADGMNGELIFELWTRGSSYSHANRAVYINGSDPHGRRMCSYYSIQSHANFLQDGMHYLGAEHINITMNDIHFHTMQFANDEQLYVCVVNLEEETIENLLITLNDESLYGSVRRHVMDEQTITVDGISHGKYYDTALFEGELEIDIPATSITFLKIDLTERQ